MVVNGPDEAVAAEARPPARPRVSIGLPVFNGERYLAEAIDSILAQSYRDFELILVDNASTDSTPEICRRYAGQDPRVRFHRNSINIGGFRNHNRAFELARGALFAWAAHDDVRWSEWLERCVETLDARPDAVMAFTGSARIGPAGQPLPTPVYTAPVDSDDVATRFATIIRLDQEVEPVYGVIRREALECVPGMGQYAGSDRVLLAELVLHGPFARVPETLFARRVHPGQSVEQYPSRQARMAWLDPDHPGRLVWPFFRQFAEQLKAVLRAPLPWRQRRRCLAAAFRWLDSARWGLRLDLICGADYVLRRLHLRRG